MKRLILQYMRRCANDQKSDTVRDIILGMADAVEAMQEPTAKRVKSVEPFIPGGTVTHQVWVCGSCLNRVDFKDTYCRDCGRRLVEQTVWHEETQE